MVNKLVDWALNSRLIVVLLALAMAAVGFHAFLNINVEAYPDPAPAIVEVIAQWPGRSGEQLERQVTIPLEVTLAGMPGLKATYSKSLFGLSHLRNVFEYGYPYKDARQEVINRLQFVTGLPAGVQPAISPTSPIGEIFRYTLKTPKNLLGQEIYTLNDIKALQDWILVREFKRVPGTLIVDVVGSGGTVKRYEIQPDSERLKRYGITLQQLESTLANSNDSVGGDFLIQGGTVKMVQGKGLIGGSKDPIEQALGMRTPEEAAAFLRQEEQERLREIRRLVVTSVNNVPIRIDDLVDGGPLLSQDAPSRKGVVVSHQTRLGRVSQDRAMDADGRSWRREDEKVQGIVLMFKGGKSLPAIEGVKKKVAELSQPGKLLPGVSIEPYYDREDLVHLTTHTVQHNLILGIALVTVILFMFLSNVRTAIIVAINIPMALLFAFSVLYLRGQSANLLSIGAVDFGIIVDSAVIMAENIYRNMAGGGFAGLPLKERILRSTREIDRALFFSTAIMVVAFLPLFTMHGAEGELFGPMAQTYAFALGGALLLALTLTPVLCLLLFKDIKPTPDNFLVRFLKGRYLYQLRVCLRYPKATMLVMGSLIAITVAWPMLQMGREFMPELEEGNLWVRGIFPVHVSLDEVKAPVAAARQIMGSPDFPEVAAVVAQVGRPDDGTDPALFNNAEFFLPLRPEKDWPEVERPNGQHKRRTRREIITDMSAELERTLPGIEWSFSQYIRDNVMEAISGVKGDNSVKIYGPDLDKLEELADKVKNTLVGIRGLRDLGTYHIMGQSNLTFDVDTEKCKRWGVRTQDVLEVINTAVRGQAFTQMVEGAKLFDITLRWPLPRRQDETSILDIPVDISNNQLTTDTGPVAAQTIVSGAAKGSSLLTSIPAPALVGVNVASSSAPMPRLRLRDLVSPEGPNGRPLPEARNFTRPGGSIITREQGKRFIAVKFSVRDRDLASAVSETKEKVEKVIPPSYEVKMGGEFEQMEDGERRLLFYIPASLLGIFLLLYLAFRSLLDAVVVLSNVLALAIGGIWALYLTNTNFSMSAAVGFVSLFGVAIMDGLLLISYFNHLRAEGLPLREAILQGAEKRVRPVMMTTLTAIFGLLPAAISTRIGAQSQRPLAIVVVGGMITTLFLTRYLMPVLYSFYGDREPPDAGGIAH